MATLTVRQAAARLRKLDHEQQDDANGASLMVALSGGFGKQHQRQTREDIQTIYAYILGERSIGLFSPPPLDVA